MKTGRTLLPCLLALLVLASSCSVFKPKYGCGTNGKNVGAEQLISGDPPRKVKKFKA